MLAEDDFQSSIDRAANATLDAACELRALRTGRLPEPHRRLVTAALGKLDWAQDILFQARHNPWTPPPKPKHRQLELL